MFEELDDHAGQGQALHALGEAHLRAGRPEAAACLARSHERFARADARLQAVAALHARGLALQRLGDRGGAVACWHQALVELGDLQVRQRAQIESLLAEQRA